MRARHQRHEPVYGRPLVGVLALQGDFAEHCRMLAECGADTILVKHAWQLEGIDGLVIPGGESTTIAKLTAENDVEIFERIKMRGREGMPIFGTCMGAIFLAREIAGSSQGRLALMDIKVQRNAFGPQKFSREELVEIPAIGVEPLVVAFIRGPIILSCGPSVQVMGSVAEGIVMARQGNLLACAFHPEVTGDTRVHKYFLSMVRDCRLDQAALAPAVTGQTVGIA